ncbi:MAG TPA: phospholipase C, phosphocholine-specific [Caulobacteraceae bacterium]
MTSSRRGFIKGAAAMGAASGAAAPAIARALATPADRRTGTVADVEHVVILMQENRAFDHYFGSLRGVRGFDDPRPLILPSGEPVWRQPREPGLADAIPPFRLNSTTTSAECMASLDHSWKAQHSLWRNHDAWIPVKGPLTMGYFTREDLPFYYALADAFTVCDGYHASMFGPTNPNRLFLFSGASGLSTGHHGSFNVANDDDGNWTADAARDRADFQGYPWTTYAERLEAAGVGWKLYQEYDNFGDNSLAFFKAFRGLAADSPLRRKGRSVCAGSDARNAWTSDGDYLIAALIEDVAGGTLPAVSWIVAPTRVCEHPNASPGLGEAFAARVVAALAANPKVWSRTVLFINYDENDGFFDHVPPPLPAVGAAAGASTASVAGEMYDLQPVGLGPRVPMIVVSPFSTGGWVNSEVFDHTSILRFLEARFGVHEPNISPWRRAVTGDLTTAFDFSRRAAAPSLPSTAENAERVAAACKLARPSPPDAPARARQESGLRPARAIPYAFDVVARGGDQSLTLNFANSGGAGVCLNVYEAGGRAGPWYYTVEPGKALDGVWRPSAGVAAYDLSVHGPNGFLRCFRGRYDPAELETETKYDPDGQRLLITVRNPGAAAREVILTPGDYSREAPRRRTLAAGATLTEGWAIRASAHWYDLSVTCGDQPDFLRRMAGHIETGSPSFSDPAIGRT